MTKIRWWMLPLGLTGALSLVQLISFPAKVQDAATLAFITDFHLNFPLVYIIFEPFFGLADALTFSVKWPTVIFILWIMALLPLFKGWRLRVYIFGSLVMFIAWAVLIPRPMAMLSADDPEVLVIDFHSHTLASHDGRPSFTREANAQWHQDQGFNASFLTEHKKISGKPIGPFSLTGEEVSLYKMSFVVLSPKTLVDGRSYSSDVSLIEPFIKEMHKRGLLVIGALPYYWMNYWNSKPNVEDFIRWGIDGFEITTGDPRGLGFPDELRQKLLALCRQHNLVYTGVSDNHGYGSTTPCWSIVRLPGWRLLSPNDLEAAVVAHLSKYRYDAVRVLERPRFRPVSKLDLALSPLGIVMVYARTLSWPQTISWIFWIWGLTGLREFLKLRRDSKKLALPVAIPGVN